MHTTPDVLALFALGEWTGSEDDRLHVSGCAECRREVDELTHAVDLAKQVTPEFLDHPAPRVWDTIVTALGMSDPSPAPAPESNGWHSPNHDTMPAQTDGRSHRPIPTTTQPERRPRVMARLTLEPLPAWPMSSGWASVEVFPGGHRQLEVILNGPKIDDALVHAWLLKPDLSGMIDLGPMDGGSSTFNLPMVIDLETYSVVDVSRQPLDGQVAHSGDSILRGELVEA